MRAARPSVPPIDRLVSELYGGLAEDMSLLPCLQGLSSLMRSHITGLRSENIETRKAKFTICGEATANELMTIAGEYERRWVGKNLWMERSVEGYLTQGFQYGEAVVHDTELRASPYFHHILAPLDIRHGLGVCVAREGPSGFVVLGFNRRASVGPVNADELALIRQLRPHLVNLYAIHRRLGHAEASRNSMRARLDRLSVGAIVLDEEGRALDRNQAADTLLASGAGLRLGADNLLQAGTVSANARLRLALASMLTGDASNSETLRFNSPGSDLRHGVVLHLRLLPQKAFGTFDPTARVLAFLYSLGGTQGTAVTFDALRSCLGLTRTETEVVQALLRHHQVDAVANVMGIAEGTVRAHIKSIFRKTGVSKQTELVLLAERIVAPLALGRTG